MTQQECVDAAIRRVGTNRVPRGNLLQFAAEALGPLTRRDETMVDGKGTVENFDRATFKSETVEIQLHRPRHVAPYRYGPADVLALEREIRRRVTI